MPHIEWSQDVFSKGELSPLMYSRVSVQAYYDSLKTATNVINLPQGAAGKRFGTEYLNEITGVTDKDNIFFEAFPYLNQADYLVVFKPDEIDIFLEDLLVKNITSTGILAGDMRTIDHTVIEDRFRVCTERFQPKDLVRRSTTVHGVSGITAATDLVTWNAGDINTNDVYAFKFDLGYAALPASTPALTLGTSYWLRSFGANFKVYTTQANALADTAPVNFTGSDAVARTITVTYKHGINTIDTGTDIVTVDQAFRASTVIAVTFETTGSLPTSSPQVRLNRTYFINTASTTTCKVYENAIDAVDETNAIDFSVVGTGNILVLSDQWALEDVTFKTKPVYDFEANYDSLTFTPSALDGTGVTLTCSQAIFESEHVGGVFVGNGGIARITSGGTATVANIDIIQPFLGAGSPAAAYAIPGAVCLLAEVAWSDKRGWPKKCSSFQNRGVFANTELLPNGLWLSSINDYEDFNDSEDDDDNAISWFPSSDQVNLIKFIVPYRSLTIHTNSGIFSTPLRIDTGITPSNFSLTKQDPSPATNVQPSGIDNQIIVLSGDDAHAMVWDGDNNAYTSNIVSVANEHLINDPQDEAPYVDFDRAGSRYLFIVNADGTMAMYQTLMSEEVSGFTPASLKQPYGDAYFRWVTSNHSGRCWFVTEREIAEIGTPRTITAVSDARVTAASTSFSTTEETACKFTTTGTLPTTTPQIAVNTYYWAVGIDANKFHVYTNQADAQNALTTYEVSLVNTADDIITIAGSNFTAGDVYTVDFTNSGGALPAGLTATDSYYLRALTSNSFKVYDTLADANADTNEVDITGAGTGTHTAHVDLKYTLAIDFTNTGTGTNQVEPWPLSTKFFIEELDFSLYVDCADKYDSTAVSTIPNLVRFNAQNVLMNGDGYGFSDTVESDDFVITAHGESVSVSEAQTGFGIEVKMETLPLSNTTGSSIKSTNLVYKKHVRSASFMFNNTIGGTINGKPISIKRFPNVQIGSPPTPASGIMELGIMKGWDDFNVNAITIDHEQPFDIRLLGIFYKIDI